MDKANFLIVDDEALLREGFKALLKHEFFVRNLFEASTQAEAEVVMSNHTIDIVLLDIHLGKDNGIKILTYLKSLPSPPRVIVVTGLEGVELMVTLLKAGVSSITFKLDGYSEILKAIRTVLVGGTYFPERITQIIRKNAYRWDTIPTVVLTDRERELLASIAQGLTTKEIASLLKMSEATAETYRIRLMKKVGVNNTAALLAYAFNNGVL